MDPRSTHPLLQYDKMLDHALRQVVRKALAVASEHGLPGAHHFYLSFRTDFPGVEMADEVKARYPEEMTIVLQHQFWGLDAEPDAFSVTLSFNNRQQRLRIPYDALTNFADPAAKFGLQFQAEKPIPAAAESAAGAPADPPAHAGKTGETGEMPESADTESASPDAAPSDKVVTLDAFRHKK